MGSYFMRSLSIVFLLVFVFNSFGQYPFEKFSAIKYKTYNGWKACKTGNEQTTAFTLTIPKFFNRQDNLTILLTVFDTNRDSSVITMLRNGRKLQQFSEPMLFNDMNLTEAVMMADINGDKLNDLKLVIPYMSNGLGINVRVIYLFQHEKTSFAKLSFDDEMFGYNRQERDFNNDGNYEIVTMSLVGYQNHSYWAFNLFDYKNNDLVNVNNKYNYPVLVQFLFKDNYRITKNMSRQKMKQFAQTEPDDYNKQ